MEAVRENVLSDILTTGAIASACTTAAVAACGYAENRNAAAPLNAISHILYGEKAARVERVSLRHTLTGVLLNSGAIMAWAAMQESLLRYVGKSTPINAASCGATVAVTAYFVDYHVVPPRLTPGFEKKLSLPSLALIYSVLGASLAAGSLLSPRKKSQLTNFEGLRHDERINSESSIESHDGSPA